MIGQELCWQGQYEPMQTDLAFSPGKRVAIFTNNDDGWATAKDLHAAGVEITAIIDSRPDCRKKPPTGVPSVRGGHVVNSTGRLGLKTILLNNGTQNSN